MSHNGPPLGAAYYYSQFLRTFKDSEISSSEELRREFG